MVAMLVAALAVAIAVLAVEASLGVTVYAMPVVGALVIATAQAVAIPLALFRPAFAMALAVAGVVASTLVSAPTADAPWPVSVAAVVSFSFTVGIAGMRARWMIGAIGWATAVVAVLVIALVRDHGDAAGSAIVADLIVFASVTLPAFGAGALIRSWSEGRRLLAHEREVSADEAARRELAEERTRIARELHDIVAHGMSAIQVQAASARFRMPDLPPAAADEFDDLATTARSAMGEMRRLLSVLREEDEAALAPQPGLDDLAELLARPAHGGALTVDDRLTSTPVPDALVGLTVYRVVQESLSNIARHAPGSAAFVAMDRAPGGAITVEVRNGAAPGIRSPHAEPGGHGLRGMRERVALVGGTMDAAPTADGGFIVRARIPAVRED